MRLGRADEQVLAVEVALVAIGDQAGAKPFVVDLGDGVIDGAPPDLGLARRLDDDELVLWRSAGVLAGPDHQRTVGRDQPFPVADRVLVELGHRQVGPDGPSECVACPWRGRGHRRFAPGAQAITIDRPAARDAAPEGSQESASAVVLVRMLARCGMVAAQEVGRNLGTVAQPIIRPCNLSINGADPSRMPRPAASGSAHGDRDHWTHRERQEHGRSTARPHA